MNFILEHPQILIGIVAAIVIGLGKIWDIIKPKPQEWKPAEEDFNPADYFEPLPPPIPEYGAMMPPPLPQYATEAEPEFARQKRMIERLKVNRETEAVAAVKTNAKIKGRALVSPSKIRAGLRNKSELRRAMVMREILGTPAGLK